MKINENYRLCYELDDIYIQQNIDGRWQDRGSISETAAMVWEGIERGLTRETLLQGVINEFDGAEEAAVIADMDNLIGQLTALGIIEP